MKNRSCHECKHFTEKATFFHSKDLPGFPSLALYAQKCRNAGGRWERVQVYPFATNEYLAPCEYFRRKKETSKCQD